jgi:glycosyltransferase involved in cell wall biosynthesis
MRSVLRRFDRLISISTYVQNRLGRFTGSAPPKLLTIYNGVDSSFFSPRPDVSNFKRNLGLENDFVVLYVGRLAWNKGLPDLINSINEVRNRASGVKLVICGKGKMENELKAQVIALKLQAHVRFVGLVEQEELPLYYASSDVVAVPSTLEPFGIVLLEAMSMGRAVVATSVGGIPEVVKDMKTGILVPPRAPTLLAEAILTLEADGALRRTLGENGRRLVESQFTLSKMAEATLQCYRAIVP